MSDKVKKSLNKEKLRREIWGKYKKKLTDKKISLVGPAILIGIYISIWITLFILINTVPLTNIIRGAAIFFPFASLLFFPVYYLINKFVWEDQNSFLRTTGATLIIMGILSIALLIPTIRDFKFLGGIIFTLSFDTMFLGAIIAQYMFYKRFKGVGLVFLYAKMLISGHHQKSNRRYLQLDRIKESFIGLIKGFDEWNAEVARIRIKKIYEFRELGLSKIILDYPHFQNKLQTYFNDAFFEELEKKHEDEEFSKKTLQNFSQLLGLNLVVELNSSLTTIFRYYEKNSLYKILIGILLNLIALLGFLFIFIPL